MVAEGQEIPEEIKADQVPAQEEGGDDEVSVTNIPLRLKQILCSTIFAHFFHPRVAYFYIKMRHPANVIDAYRKKLPP